jgi:hypothetical protein
VIERHRSERRVGELDLPHGAEEECGVFGVPVHWSVVVSFAISGILLLSPSWLHCCRKCTASAPTISTKTASGEEAWTCEMYGV